MDMVKNVMIPISNDGLSKSVIKKLTAVIGSDAYKIILTFVSDPLPPYIYAEYTGVLEISPAEHKKTCKLFADKLFAKAGVKLEGVAYETCHVYNINIADGIIEAASKCKANLIVMASHKRRGLKGIFLGSETHRVIIHTKLPVLVL
jgi:nucleotide-binding universal stress UspA family protein